MTIVPSPTMSPQSGTGAGRHRRKFLPARPLPLKHSMKKRHKTCSHRKHFTSRLRLFSNKHKTLSDLPNGASIAIPERSIQRRPRLLLLEKNGLLKLKEGVNPVKAVVSDIASNPKNLKIIELEAPQLPRALEDCDASIINGGYAVSADWIRKRLSPRKTIPARM